MAEIKLQKRYKYAGDIMPKLLDIGFDLETANDFLNSIPDADVVPRALAEEQSVLWRDHFNSIYETAKVTLAAEVAREIFEEIERLNKEVDRLSQCVLYHDGIVSDLEKDLFNAKAEAIKEFAERFKEIDVETFAEYDKHGLEYVSEERIHNTIDTLAKEMTEKEV